ncbi:MAG: TerB family tellurite resistance protein [Bdellovibrionales bacterium]|nr:TerB family tellurite resistance protein [Bdellovibrionales bacterium]
MYFTNFEAFLEDDVSLLVDKTGTPTRRDFQLAVAVLLLAMAHEDQQYCFAEGEEIALVLSEAFGLCPEDCGGLIDSASLLHQNARKLSFFLETVNYHFDVSQKQQILKMLWLVAEADGVVQQVEAQLATDVRVRLGLTMEQALRAREIAELEAW